MLAFEFICGHPPFEAETQIEARVVPQFALPLLFSRLLVHYAQTYRRIAAVDLRFPEHVSPEARDFISKVCLYCHRLTPLKPLKFDCGLQLLRKNPADRMKLPAISTHPWILKHSTPTSSGTETGAVSPGLC